MPATPNPPTERQLAYLRRLSGSRSSRFARPATATAASLQIAALKAMPASASDHQIERDLGASVEWRPGAVAPIRAHEIDGYGSHASWRRGDLGPE